ncbi:MAG: hypothetical protein KBH99_00850 [Syntrophobacteraceae bacterium]|nr:hypothetical protein [Syntrophobacteraceae bacterium]
MDDRKLLEELFNAIELWEDSPYYLPSEELFDLERFLLEHNAHRMKQDLENIYGSPLNQKFWSSFLAYHRLKKVREEIRAQETLQEERRRRYLEAVEEEKRAWREWLKDWFHCRQRQKLRLLPGGKRDDPS